MSAVNPQADIDAIEAAMRKHFHGSPAAPYTMRGHDEDASNCGHCGEAAEVAVVALGAAVTPTPQDEKRAFCDWRCTDAPHTHPVTSTPEAATERGCSEGPFCELHPQPQAVARIMAEQRASGLQRATEQKADYFDFAEMRAGSDTPADQPEPICANCGYLQSLHPADSACRNSWGDVPVLTDQGEKP